MRKKFVAGNWKMNKTFYEAKAFVSFFRPLVKKINDVDIVIAPPFTLMNMMYEACRGSNIKLAVQNLHFEKQGAYTGEISSLMAKEFADYAIIGHSERRHYFGETDKLINKKIISALDAGLSVIFCVGETQDQRDAKNTKKIISEQISEGLDSVKNLKNIILAYEPVWAIGTGKSATPEQAEEVHLFIRDTISKAYSETESKKLRIIYGGSVTPENACTLLRMPNIDGCLPGGASLYPDKLAKIIASF